jgi:glycerate kinase
MTARTRVLLALDKFKDAIEADEACAILHDVISKQQPRWAIDSCPIADGGEGFTRILVNAAEGAMRTVRVTGPRGDRVSAEFGWVRYGALPLVARRLLGFSGINLESHIAVIEMAQASGLALVPSRSRNPLRASTVGTGELIRAATRAGAAGIVMGVGGSATSDLGLGALSALGLRCFTARGERLQSLAPVQWSRIARIAGNIRSVPPIRIACDVDNPLLGENGAAAIYGPQKGLKPADYSVLEEASAKIAAALCRHFVRDPKLVDVPGAGAAGGIAFGFLCAADAKLVGGWALVSAWLGLESRLRGADIVVTGEGRFDAQSFSGKGPGSVVHRALALGKVVHVFCGRLGDVAPQNSLHLHQISAPEVPLRRALRDCRKNLRETGERVFRFSR